MCLDVDMLQHAQTLLHRALELDAHDPHTHESLEECRLLIGRPTRWAAAGQLLRAQLDALNARARPAAAIRQLHIVCKLDTLGGTESRAMNLYRRLSALLPTTLWSTSPVHAAHAEKGPIRENHGGRLPSGGALALIGTYFDCGDWLENEAFDRIVVCHNLPEQYASLGRRLRQIEMNPSHPEVRLTFPSELFKQTSGMPGRVEYSPIDLAAFRCRVPRTAGRVFTVGRHGRAHPMKFHPNDPAFFRSIMARGHARETSRRHADRTGVRVRRGAQARTVCRRRAKRPNVPGKPRCLRSPHPSALSGNRRDRDSRSDGDGIAGDRVSRNAAVRRN